MEKYKKLLGLIDDLAYETFIKYCNGYADYILSPLIKPLMTQRSSTLSRNHSIIKSFCALIKTTGERRALYEKWNDYIKEMGYGESFIFKSPPRLRFGQWNLNPDNGVFSHPAPFHAKAVANYYYQYTNHTVKKDAYHLYELLKQLVQLHMMWKMAYALARGDDGSLVRRDYTRRKALVAIANNSRLNIPAHIPLKEDDLREIMDYYNILDSYGRATYSGAIVRDMDVFRKELREYWLGNFYEYS